ncbi:MAG: xylulokinase [Alkalispirochaeta sp.]
MERDTAQRIIANGEGILGIELGSTRIKATMIAPEGAPIASGSYGWENRLVDGIWTYDMEDVRIGLAACYGDLAQSCRNDFDVEIPAFRAIGISGMMHGYIALDAHDELLVPFRTWRNNITGEASEALSRLFTFPVPQRWSIAHLYQAILNGEDHISRIRRMTTLAGYVHYLLTGVFAVGADEASGMFPVDPVTGTFYRSMTDAFDETVSDRGFPWKVAEILPTVHPVGKEAGTLTPEGAAILDSTLTLQAGIPLCPPEGDAGTGMVATNSVRKRTGNVSAGTSVFAMIVLEKSLSRVHSEIDLVLTPDGSPVAMAHSNNCTSDLDAWVRLIHEAVTALGVSVPIGQVYERLLPLALEGDIDVGGLLSIGYVSGEHVTGFTEGRPLFVRNPDGRFTIANFMRSHLFAALGAMRTGLDILTEEEGVTVEEIRGHGGFFKIPGVGDRIMAAATGVPVRVQETAGEGGAWGMALLAAYMVRDDRSQSLPDFLETVFAETAGTATDPVPDEVESFNAFFKRYQAGLAVERAAVDALET